MKTKMIILTLFLAGSLLGAVLAVTATAAPAATIAVDSTADALIAGDNECTLREAINNANGDSDTTGGDCAAGSGADVIELPAGTYALAIGGPDEDANATGDLDILESLTINGAGADSTTISANGLNRVLNVLGAGTSAVLNDLTFADGQSTQGVRPGGAGILNEEATLTLNDSVVRNNTVTVEGDVFAHGGGVLNLDGNVTLNNTRVYENQVVSDAFFGGGGVANGAWSSAGSLTVMNSEVISNSAPGGGGIANLAGTELTATLTVVSSTVAYNTAAPAVPGGAAAPGGGIWNTYFAGAANPTTVVDIEESVIEGNVTDGGSGGGGIYSPGGASAEITIDRTTIRDNQALGNAPFTATGGGVLLIDADILIDSTTIVSNTASGTVDFSGLAGGIFLLDSSSTVVNSTISGNAAVGNPDGTASGNGGAVLVGSQNVPSAASFINTTVANNNANGSGGGLTASSLGSTVTLSFVNTLFAGNTAPVDANCSELGGLGGPPVTWTSMGHNVDDEDTCRFDQPSDQVNTDPLLGPLHDNGGPTWTHALSAGSPAIDAGDDAVCAAPPVNALDQRGVARPVGPSCDTGAYERERSELNLPIVFKQP